MNNKIENQTDIEKLINTMFQLKKLISNKATETHEDRIATMLQFSALSVLMEQKNCSMTNIVKSLQLSKSSATQLIERLFKAKLVERMIDIDDRRNVRLKITEKGKEEFILLKKKIIEKMTKILLNIPDHDIKELIRIHTNLITTLKTDIQP